MVVDIGICASCCCRLRNSNISISNRGRDQLKRGQAGHELVHIWKYHLDGSVVYTFLVGELLLLLY